MHWLQRLTARGRSALDALRGSYWFLPAVMTSLAGLAALALVRLNVSLSLDGPLSWLILTDADAARAVLSVIAGSMVTVTGLVFSINIVALTLASTQFGPRLLRTFLRDRVNQLVFGAFTGTFLYSLIVLMAVTDQGVPRLASALAVALAVLSLFVLIYFIHHTVTSIQASSVIAGVAAELQRQLTELFPERLGQAAQDSGPDAVAGFIQALADDGVALRAPGDGFIRVIDQRALSTLVDSHDLQLLLTARPGDFVAAGMVLGRVGPAAAVDARLCKELAGLFVLGGQRSAVQDLAFLIDQLTEVAARALSPGVNDPRTASACTQQLGAVLCAVADRHMPAGARADEAGRLRVVAPALTFERIAALALDPIRQYGAEHPEVVLTVFEVLRRVGDCCPAPVRRRLLREHLEAFHDAFGRSPAAAAATDAARVQEAFEQARDALG
ncbi:MAG: DUF2254 domain-containing protein [Pseudomonadota bacterium]|nr:DUF2254 domain-containing protein [Pseudomonadota bacterium]